MDLDRDIERWVKKLGLNVVVPPNAPEPFHISTAPPTGMPVLDVVRPKDAEFYVIAMGIAVHPDHRSALASMKEQDRRRFLLELKRAVASMGVDFAFLPPDAEIPDAVQVSRPVLAEGLDAQRFVDEYYRVRNAGLLVIISFAETFRRAAGQTSLYA